MPSAETTQLFQQARNGAPGALDAFYERCARKLLPLIRLRMGRALRSELESRDILQAVLFKSLQRLDQVQDPHAVMAWLARIAENEIRDQADFRQRQKRDAARRAPLEAAADVPAPVRQALSQAIVNEQMARIEEALESMSRGRARDHRAPQARRAAVPGHRRATRQERRRLPHGVCPGDGGADAAVVEGRMTDSSDLETRLAELIEHHERDGRWPSARDLTADPSQSDGASIAREPLSRARGHARRRK